MKSCYSDRKCPRGRYGYVTIIYKTSLRSAARHTRLTQVAKGRGMGKRRLLKGVRCGVLSPLSFTPNGIIRYLGQAWLGKATDIAEERRGNVN